MYCRSHTVNKQRLHWYSNCTMRAQALHGLSMLVELEFVDLTSSSHWMWDVAVDPAVSWCPATDVVVSRSRPWRCHYCPPRVCRSNPRSLSSASKGRVHPWNHLSSSQHGIDLLWPVGRSCWSAAKVDALLIALFLLHYYRSRPNTASLRLSVSVRPSTKFPISTGA